MMGISRVKFLLLVEFTACLTLCGLIQCFEWTLLLSDVVKVLVPPSDVKSCCWCLSLVHYAIC